MKMKEHILCVVESKIDKYYTTAQFMLPGCHKPYRLNIRDREGGLLVCIKFHLPSRLLKNFDIPSNIQIIAIKLNLRGKNGCLCAFTDLLLKTNNIS